MELRHLRYFVAIAEERSVTRAAERLWLAQPGLSTQIRRLEAELGVQLLERHARGVDLTCAGSLFLERARAALAAAELARSTGSDLETGAVGTLRLGIATGPRWCDELAVLERFADECSGIELTVLRGYGGTLGRDLHDGRLDAMLAPTSFSSADLRRLTVGAEPWVAVVGAGHRLAGTGPLAAHALNGEQIAVTAHRDGAGYDRAIAELLAELGVAAALVRAAPEPALHRSVVEGAAVALTTAPAGIGAEVFVRPLDPPRALAFDLLWRDGTPAPALPQLISAMTRGVKPAQPAHQLLTAVA